ncbi:MULTISPECIES: Rnf-Nqr domain containing protein [unclassified Pseudomonas]|uniref:Rnf-Nqr domain containing protein n=1 Tax=unclassified Pseudomonas TaxID=196821 RepID=UPI0024489BA4|nr:MULTISPECIES: Rnf-Nqr domain containing protein [unclassified Pseudomonas]MDG9923640.1 NADH:quinone oxidoreductase [Pseudomonas sp. GD04045]MDH0036402.1 NADH:quinone oxidoreductase [Pseudomonas sp. GD04019]
MTDFLFALIGAALVSNLILGLPLAADALRHARGQALGLAGALLILLAAPSAWLLQQALQVVELSYLYLLIGLPLLAALSWLSLALLSRLRPSLLLDGLWPLLLGNGLGAMLLARSLENFSAALALGIGGGLGFWLVLQLMSDLIERIEQCDVPAAFRGTPILLIAAGLMGLAFLGFNGMGAA